MVEVYLRQQKIDVADQEIMTADRVSLCKNTVVTYRIVDAQQAVTVTDGSTQSLNREAPFALRNDCGHTGPGHIAIDNDAVKAAFEQAMQ